MKTWRTALSALHGVSMIPTQTAGATATDQVETTGRRDDGKAFLRHLFSDLFEWRVYDI